MFAGIGLVILFAMVFGGFALTGGDLAPIMEAIPHEMLVIGGAAIGSIIAGNSMKELKAVRRRLRQGLQGAAVQQEGLSRRHLPRFHPDEEAAHRGTRRA